MPTKTIKQYQTDITGGGGGSTNAFGTIVVAGQSNVVADAAPDILTLVAGTNTTITTNAATDTITIAVPAYGSAAGTICQGNDSRLSDARTPASHTVVSHSDWPSGLTTTELGYVDGATSNIQTQINSKQATISAGTTSQYYRGDKSWQTLDKSAVGLGNVDNTTDANKPISTATQTALDSKSATSHNHDSTYEAKNTNIQTHISTTNIHRNITESTADPSGGSNGDIWFKYTP